MGRKILDNRQLRDISRMHRNGYTQQEIAEIYGISQGTVSNALQHFAYVSEIQKLRTELKEGDRNMAFEYKGRLEGLATFYASMKQQNIEIGTFDHSYNGVESCVIFDTSGDRWRLVFIKRGIGETLVIPIEVGYRFSITGDEKYREFIRYFGIRGGRGEFHIGDFKSNLDGQIPDHYELTNSRRQDIIHYDRIDSGSDGIFPIGTVNWQLLHAAHPEWPAERYHRSADNLKKTRQLYPHIYAATKNIDVSIRYGTEPEKETENMINGNYAWKQETDEDKACDFIVKVCADINNGKYNPEEIKMADTLNRKFYMTEDPVYCARFSEMDRRNIGPVLAEGIAHIQ